MSMITGAHYSGPEPTSRAILCLTCEANSQEGSDLFNLKGAIAHCKEFGKEGRHGEFKEVELHTEFIATMGGYVETAGCAYDP